MNNHPVNSLDQLSPKLKTFFSFEDNNPKFRGIQNIDERFPVGYSSGGRAGKNKFLPSQLLNGGENESLTSDGGSSVSSILHNIFSPKFHAQSAKKKKKNMMMMNTESKEVSRQQTHQNTPHYHKQQQQHSIFSPMSAISTPGRGQQNHDANNASILSEMSDEFSTIHAILRGNALKDYRKSVGWEAASHPIHWSDSDDVKLDNSPTIDKEYPRVAYGKVVLESKVESVDIISNDNVQYIHQQVESDGDNDIDDSTEVMLNMAIRMTSPENATNHANTTKTPGKRPSPIHNDEFHTPSSSMKPRKSSPVMAIPLAFKSDLDSRILGGILPPVWEGGKGHYNSDVRQLDASTTSSSIDVKEDFRTSKQHGKVDHYDENDSDNNDDDDDEEEFFSPLAAHTASLKKHDTSNLNSNTVNTLVSTLTAIDFNNYAITVPSKRMTLSLPKNSAQLPTTNKDSGLTSPEASTTPFTVFHDNHPQDASHKCTSSHLHSPRVSTLSPDALTIDYIKSCTCIETLNTIHSLLTDVNNVTIHRNNHGKRGKQLRYPSLVRLVERQIQRLQQENLQKQQQTTSAEPLTVQLLPRVARGKVLGSPLEDNDGGSDKENVNPRQPFIHDNGHPTTITADETTRASPIPMQCIGVLHESSADRHGSPGSISMSRSSLDMNLSGSMMFALDDESHYWRQGGMADSANLNSNQNQGDVELTVHSIEEKAMTAEHFDKQSQTFDQDCIIKSYMELEDKLAMTLSANVILTSEVDSLVNEQQEIKAELSAKLGHMTKQLSRQQDIAASESTTQQAQIAELDRMKHSLREEIEHLYRQLHLVNHNAESTALQLQFEIEDAKNKWSNHSTDKESLNKELIDIRSRYEKLLNEKKTVTLESKNTQKLRLFAESAKLANAALANSLAVSEKDLAEANAAREKSERECDALRKHVVRLEDKASFLSAKLKEMSAELQSGHAYIDKLYADLQEIESSSVDLKCDFERRELEWTELERRYSQRISELENKYGSESKNKVSLEAYMTVVKQTRHYKAEATKNQQTIDSLKERLAAGKATRALQVIGVSMPIHCNSQIEQQGRVVSKSGTQQGKHLNRVSVIRAAGGRKGLTEQLKRARGISPKANNTPSFTL